MTLGKGLKSSVLTTISPLDLRQAVAILSFERIMTPSITACPPTFRSGMIPFPTVGLPRHCNQSLLNPICPLSGSQTNYIQYVGKTATVGGFLFYFVFLAAFSYFRRKRSTRPAVSTSFCLPVKNGWQLAHISTEIDFLVERVGYCAPHAHVITVS